MRLGYLTALSLGCDTVKLEMSVCWK